MLIGSANFGSRDGIGIERMVGKKGSDVKAFNFEPLTEDFWNESISAYAQAFDGWEITDPELHNTCRKLIDPLVCRVLGDVVEHGRIRVCEGAQVTGFDRYLGANLTVQSGPVLQRLEFGIYWDHRFVETLVPFADSIPNVKEGFWDDVSEVVRTARTTFEENMVVPTRTVQRKQLMRSGRSVQYRMIRNYVLMRSDAEGDTENIGILTSGVPIDEPMAATLPKLRKLFKLYYGLLMQLYRPAYQKGRLARKRWVPGGETAEM